MVSYSAYRGRSQHLELHSLIESFFIGVCGVIIPHGSVIFCKAENIASIRFGLKSQLGARWDLASTRRGRTRGEVRSSDTRWPSGTTQISSGPSSLDYAENWL